MAALLALASTWDCNANVATRAALSLNRVVSLIGSAASYEISSNIRIYVYNIMQY